MRLFEHGILLASAVSLLALGACSADKAADATATAAKGPAVATVNGKAIQQSLVDLAVRQGASSGRPDTPETRQAIVEQLTMQAVVADAAVGKGLDKSEGIAEQIDAVRQSILANAYVQDYIKNNPVTDEALRAEYERIKATLTGSEYKARHILVEKEDEAKAIIAQLKKGAKFEDIAKKQSKDPGSGAQGGDLGWANPSGYVPEFAQALGCLLYTSPSPRDRTRTRMPSSA